MKKVLLLSDTHGHIDDRILHYAQDVDEIWHAGDIGNQKVVEALTKEKPFRAVYGNIDDAQMRAQFPENLFFEVEGVKVFMTHIGGYPPKYNSRSLKLINEHKPKIFISGHSHILKVMPDSRRDLIHMNPGAAGIYGFHEIRTMLRFTIDNGNIGGLEVIELGKRGKI
ncbi:metallophosphoesterase [Ornithobacterium rhinotracheale]|uniref:metallophosphoesterase family protein n=1 Tax=Ornithobacterium rhinotracheale TaxID=28251 RepID=UPI00129D0453|nr:metallophosphoesterase family protein [Ornithobacterium rhinotracheale]MRI62968.1 metallophosphoesterase [Ornithobacterium rhinotracheale]